MFRRRHQSCLIAIVYLLLVVLLACFSLLFLQATLRSSFSGSKQREQLQQQQLCEPQTNNDVTEPSAVEENGRFSMYEMPARRPYPKRTAMGQCPPVFGRVMVIVLVQSVSFSKYYGVAQNSLDCYIRGTNYTLKRVDLDTDARAKHACSKYKNLFFRKHCIVANYLNETDWMLVLDADTGVVNPNHCVEEWIDDRVDVIFYERFFNWEITSGNYLIKNTPFARQFLMQWAEMEFWQPFFASADNGALQLHILKTVLPHAKIEINACERYWNRSADYDMLMAYTTCVRSALGAQRIWPPKLRIYRRAHGFARDWFITDDAFSDFDFMFHGWKRNTNTDEDWKSPFEQVPSPNECKPGGSYQGWHWRKGKRVSANITRVMLAEQERHSAVEFPAKARIHSHLTEPDIGECYPECEEDL